MRETPKAFHSRPARVCDSFHEAQIVNMTYGRVNLAVEIRFLELEETGVVLHLRVHIVLDVHRSLFTFRFLRMTR